jgi:hypothetical protein
MATKEVEMKPVGFGDLEGEMGAEESKAPEVFDRRCLL